jgi:hypothetical protein
VYEKVGLPPHKLMPCRGDVIERDVLEAALAL